MVPVESTALARGVALPAPGPGWDIALDRAEQLGANTIAMPLSWADADDAAFDLWARSLDACHDRGLTPIVDLAATRPPASLGPDAWRRTTTVDAFAAWADAAAERLSGRCRHWLTMAPPALFAVDTWLAGVASFGRRIDVAAAIRTIDNLAAAHVLAHECIHRRQPQALVALRHHPLGVYELDCLVLDVLLARSANVERYRLPTWLSHRRALVPPAQSMSHRVVRRWARNAIPMEKALPRLIAAVYDGPHVMAIDVLHIEAGHRNPLHHLRHGHRDAPGAEADVATLRAPAAAMATAAVPVWVVAGSCAGLPLDQAEGTATDLAGSGVDVLGVVVSEGHRRA